LVKKNTILIVDDFRDGIDLLVTILSRFLEGLRILTALGGREGLEMAAQEQPDLILLDVKMPDLDGYDTCRLLKKLPRTSHIPVLMISGVLVEKDDRLKGLDSGADGYICKPFSSEELIGQIKALLRIKRQADEIRRYQHRLEEQLEKRTRDLKRREQQFAVLFEQSPDAVFVEDLSGNVLELNEAACKLHGASREHLIGRNVIDLVPAREREMVRRDFSRWATGELTYYEGWSQRANGTAVPVEIRASRIQFGEDPALLLHVRDISARRKAESELLESQQRYRMLYDHLPSMYFTLSPEGSVLTANPQAEEVLGHAEEELVGRSILRLFHPEDREAARHHLEECLKHPGREHSWEFRIRKKDGTDIWARNTARAMEDGDQTVLHVICNDVTSRKQVEERDRRITAGLNAVVEIADVLILCPTLDDLYRSAVDLARRKLGVERAGIFVLQDGNVHGTFGTNRAGETTDERSVCFPVSGDWLKCFTPAQPGERRCRIVPGPRSEFSGGQSVDIGPGWVAMTPVVGSGGTPYGVFCNDAAITGTPEKPELQEIISVYASLLASIIQRKRTDEQLRLAEERYRTLVEQLPVITYRVEVREGKGLTTYISPQIEAILGFTSGEWIERPDLWIQQLHEEDRERVSQAVAEADRTGRSFELEYRVRTRGGMVRWFRNHGVYVLDEEGRPRWLHGVMLDITRQKEAEEREGKLLARLSQAQRMESLGLLAGGVAHDLNNILGPVVGYPDLILAELPEESPLRQDIQEIKNSARRAAEVIQDLLALARRGNYHIEPIDLNHLVSQHMQGAECAGLKRENPDVRVGLHLDERTPWLKGSPPHLQRVLTNLITNAYEAMPNGGTLSLQTGIRRALLGEERDVTDPPPFRAVLSIADTGEGIPPEFLEHIFEPFFTRRRMGRSGTGLGLAVVYGVVKDLNGQIEVQSEVGRGSTFELSFPLAAAPALSEQNDAQDYHGTERILVVDDVEEQRELAGRLLGKLGYQVQTAANLHQAVACIRNDAIDLLVLDMILESDSDGLDVYEALLALRPGLPCVIASGYAETDRVRKAQELGAGAYLRKPYSLERIGRAVRDTLSRASR